MNSPIRKTHSFAFMRKHDVAAVVSVLLGACGPLAIAFAVACIVVNAVYGESFGVAWSHVGDEFIHVVPFLANGYSSAAITIVSLVVFVVASAHHALPDGKKRVSPRSVLGYSFLVKATAAFNLAIAKSANMNKPVIGTAVALYFGNFCVRSDLPEESNNSVSAIAFANKNGFCRGPRSKVVSFHSGVPFAQKGILTRFAY